MLGSHSRPDAELADDPGGETPMPVIGAPTLGLLHRLSERLTAAGNYVTGLQRRIATRHGCPTDAEILRRAALQLKEAAELFHQLRRSLDEPLPANRRAGRNYRVCFMNRFARGHTTITACQRTIVVHSASSREAAIETAKHRFAEIEGVRDWRIRASLIEAALLEGDAADAASQTTPSASESIR